MSDACHISRTALTEIPDVAFEKVNGQLFPVIGMGERAAVTVNFDAKLFKWVKDKSTDNSDEVKLEKKE